MPRNFARPLYGAVAVLLVLGAVGAAITPRDDDASNVDVAGDDALADATSITLSPIEGTTTTFPIDAATTTPTTAVAGKTTTTRGTSTTPKTTAVPAGPRCATPATDRIAFIDVKRANESGPDGYLLKIYDFGNGQSKQLGANTSFYPQWSADGCELVVEDQGAIKIFTLDGVSRTVSPGGTQDIWPAMSPDNQLIAFVNTQSLWVMKSDGSARRELARLGGANSSPSWSPDSHKIAFTANTPNGDQIFTINSDGTGKTQLTSDAKTGEQPMWSPDGNWVGYTLTGSGSAPDDAGQALYIVRGDGSGAKRMTKYSARFSWGWAANSASVVIGENIAGVNEADPRTHQLRVVDVASGGSQTYPVDGEVQGASFSPSGKTVAYYGTCAGHDNSLCAGDMASGAIRLLVDYAGTGRPTFAPR